MDGYIERQTDRRRVLRTAKVLMGRSVMDCLVLDRSATGMRVSNEVPTAYPAEVCKRLAATAGCLA